MSSRRRAEPREKVDLDLQLPEGGQGRVRDLSVSGLYFDSNADMKVGDSFNFELELDSPLGPIRILAEGEIVRRVDNEDRNGFGVRISSQKVLLK